LDENGFERTITIPNSFYIPDSNIQLLSPQHWAQEVNNNSPTVHGTWCATYFDKIILYWQQAQLSKTISIDRSVSNTGILWTIPNTHKYSTFHHKFHEKQLHLHSAPSMYSKESFTGNNASIDTLRIMDISPPSTTTTPVSDSIDAFNFDIQLDNESTSISPEEELMQWNSCNGIKNCPICQ
jgi:hypothetical protein